jgi:hypothetical protein
MGFLKHLDGLGERNVCEVCEVHDNQGIICAVFFDQGRDLCIKGDFERVHHDDGVAIVCDVEDCFASLFDWQYDL